MEPKNYNTDVVKHFVTSQLNGLFYFQ